VARKKRNKVVSSDESEDDDADAAADGDSSALAAAGSSSSSSKDKEQSGVKKARALKRVLAYANEVCHSFSYCTVQVTAIVQCSLSIDAGSGRMFHASAERHSATQCYHLFNMYCLLLKQSVLFSTTLYACRAKGCALRRAQQQLDEQLQSVAKTT
jgi:hypothetical protein